MSAIKVEHGEAAPSRNVRRTLESLQFRVDN